MACARDMTIRGALETLRGMRDGPAATWGSAAAPQADINRLVALTSAEAASELAIKETISPSLGHINPRLARQLAEEDVRAEELVELAVAKGGRTVAIRPPQRPGDIAIAERPVR